MTSADLKRLFPNASASTLAANQAEAPGPVSDTIAQHHQKAALGRAVQGKEESLERVVVRFTGYRVRPLDPDNFAGSCKDLLDGLRHASIIRGDEWWRIKLETEQEKVSSYSQERTEIEVWL